MHHPSLSIAPQYDREKSLRTFAAEMQTQASILEREIKAEEDRAGRHDPSDIAYPMTAKAMRDRRQNITFTIATLESAMSQVAQAA